MSQTSEFEDVGQNDPLGLGFNTDAPGLLNDAAMPDNALVQRHFERRAARERDMADSLGQTMHSLSNSLNNDPFKLARVSRESRLSPAIVDGDLAFAQEKTRSDRFAEKIQDFNEDSAPKSPVTMNLVENMESGADMLALYTDEALLRLESQLPENQQTGFGHIAGAWEAGMLQREANLLLQKPLFQGIAPTEEEEARLSVISRTLQYLAQRKKELGILPWAVRGTVESLGVPLAGMLSQGVQFAPVGMVMGAAYGASTGAVVGGVGALPGAIVGSMEGFGAAMGAGAVKDIFEQEAASLYGELRTMEDDYGEKINDGLARTLAIAGGLTSAGLEYLGFKSMGKAIPGLEKRIDKSSAAAALTWLNKNPSTLAKLGDGALKALRGIAGEVGTEVAQEHVGMAAEEIGRRFSDMDIAAISRGEYRSRIGEVVKETIGATILPMGFGGGARAYRNIRHQARKDAAMSKYTENRHLVMDKMADAARNSRVFGELPEVGEELVTALAENGVVGDTVYIRPEAAQRVFFQEGVEEGTEEGSGKGANADFGAIAEQLGITPESLQENLALGTDVAIPVQKAMSHLFRDEGLYKALRGDMRFEPDMPTDAELDEILALNGNTEARAAYIDSLLGGVVDEMDAAQNRHDQRMELTSGLRTQLVKAGYTQSQADAYGLLWAANAERMAPMHNQTPGEYLQSRMAGFTAMTPEEFEALDSERMYEQLMAEMGVKKGMSAAARRRVLQPEFGYAWGKLSQESIINAFGKSVYNQLRKQFGVGFFAKKGQGVSFDVLAMEFASMERGGYFNNNDVDGYEFAEKIMMPHDEFETGWKNMMARGSYNQAAMYRSNAENVHDFINEATASPPAGSAPFFHLKNDFGDTVIELGAFQVRHIKNGHQDFTEWERIPEVIETSGERIAIGKNKATGTDTFAYILPDNGSSLVVIATPDVGGKGRKSKATRTVVLTAFRDNATAVNNWIANKKAALSQSTGELLPNPDAPGVNPSGPQSGVENSISRINEEVNTLLGKVNTFNQAAPTEGTIDVDGVERPVQNSEGRQIHPTVEGQKAFWRWFGDSKVVDEDGRPLVVYHGTDHDFQEFSGKKSGEGNAGIGKNTFYFSDSAGTSGTYAGTEIVFETAQYNKELQKYVMVPFAEPMYRSYENGSIYPVYLSIKDPLIVDAKGNSWEYIEFGKGVKDLDMIAKYAKKNKKSGLIVKNVIDTKFKRNIKRIATTYVAFSPEQIKSVFNRGTFDPKDPMILHQSRDNAPGPSGPRGAIRQMDDGRWLVGLFRNKNASTVIHETGHFFLENLREAAGLENAPDWVKESWAALQSVYGFEGFPDGQAWVDVQERFAREFEAYTREGKAPANELQAAFNSFRNWLTEIYRSVKKLLGGDELTPEIREVFDRLLATDEEIDAARKAGADTSVMDSLADDADVSPELKDRYAALAQKALENAQAVVANRRLVEQRAKERELRAAATEKIDADPAYRTINEIRERGGLNLDALLERVTEDTAYRLRDKWHERGKKWLVTRKKDSVDIDEAVAALDADTPQQMVGALLSMPSRAEAIQAEVDAGLAQWEADFDGSIEYSNAMDEALAVELEALTGERQASAEALRREMDLRAGVKKAAEVDAEYKALKAGLRKQNQVLRAALKEWKAARLAEDAQARQAAKEKLAQVREQERLKRAALGAAYRMRIERANIIAQIRKAAQSKTVEDGYRQQLLRLVAHFRGLGTPSMAPRDAANMPTLTEFMGQNMGLFEEEQGLLPDWIYAESGRAGAAAFNDLTIEQMRDVHRAVKLLEHKGRQYGKLLAQGKKTEVLLVARQCAERMDKLGGKRHLNAQDRESFLGKLRGGLRGALSSITIMRHLFKALDNYSEDGPLARNLTNVLQKAQSAALRLSRIANDAVVAAGRHLGKIDLKKAFAIDGVPLTEDVQRDWGGLWTMEKVLSVALNMGNAGNMKALMTGYGWSAEHVRAITSRLTEEQWKFVQGVWDAIETLYPALSEAYETLHGVPMQKVEAAPFTVQTADGRTIQLRGGYYPLMFDRNFSDRAADQQSKDDLLNGIEAAQRVPNPKSGMTKTRQGGTLPPRLSFSVISDHIRDTAHYASHAVPLRDAVQLVRNPVFRRSFERAAGQENYNLLLPWLQGIARPDGQYAGKLQRALEKLGTLGTLYALGMNMKSAILQLTSVGSSMMRIGPARFLMGCASMLRQPRERWELVREKSEYMRNRSSIFDLSARTAFSNMTGARLVSGGKVFTVENVQRAQMGLIVALDAAVAYPTWIGAYDRAVAKGMTDEDAVTAADSAVIEAQASGGAMDVSEVMRNRGWIRFLCPFMSFAQNDFNRKKYYSGALKEKLTTGFEQFS